MKLSARLSYLCAPKRKELSPLGKFMLSEKLLTPDDSYLDYGCGHGFDFKYFQAHGYVSTGYDPHYYPNKPTTKADVVTLGYVLNVLEDFYERIKTVKMAWKLAKKRLIIAVNSGNEERITSWGTFTKAFSQIEGRALIDVSTGKICKPIGTGKFLVERSAPKCYPKTREEVEKAIAKITSQGYIAPIGAYVQKYYVHKGKRRKNYYRLMHRLPILPGNRNLIHLPNINSAKYKWAIESIKRRNQILRMKFHCQDFCFLDEFRNMTHFSFLQ